METERRRWNKPVHSGVVKKAADKGVKNISAESFTKPAQALAKKLEVNLMIMPNDI